MIKKAAVYFGHAVAKVFEGESAWDDAERWVDESFEASAYADEHMRSFAIRIEQGYVKEEVNDNKDE